MSHACSMESSEPLVSQAGESEKKVDSVQRTNPNLSSFTQSQSSRNFASDSRIPTNNIEDLCFEIERYTKEDMVRERCDSAAMVVSRLHALFLLKEISICRPPPVVVHRYYTRHSCVEGVHEVHSLS